MTQPAPFAPFIAVFRGLAWNRMSRFAALMTCVILAVPCVQAWLEVQWFLPQAQQQARLAHSLKTAKLAPAPAAPDPLQTRLDDVLQRLHRLQGIHERIVQIHDIAARRGVLLRHANYKKPPTESGIARLDMQVDLSGSYPAVRLFLRDLVQQDPAAAIESLDFAISPGMDGIITRARLVLFAAP